MQLIKYRDEMNGETAYSYFWTHEFGDGVEKIVSDVFDTRESAMIWYGQMLKELKGHKYGIDDGTNKSN
jgi:hypothetical protein